LVSHFEARTEVESVHIWIRNFRLICGPMLRKISFVQLELYRLVMKSLEFMSAQDGARAGQNSVLVGGSNRTMKRVGCRCAERISRKTFCTRTRTEKALKRVVVTRFTESVLKARLVIVDDCS
jgi:hypothetical protein